MLRRSTFLTLILIFTTVMTGLFASSALAQTEPAPASPVASDSSDSTAQPAAESGSTFIWLVKTSGAIGFFLLLLSIYFVATVVRLFMELRLDMAAPPEVIEEANQLLANHDFKGAYALLKDDPSFFAKVSSMGIAELPQGLPAAREAMQYEGEVLTVNYEKQISILAVIGTLGPMIGLLGTLKGMIAAFSVIAMSGTELRAAEVAGAISEALVLTFEGVGISIPAIYFYSVFRNRVSQISAQTMLEADHFVRRFSNTVRSRNASSNRNTAVPAETH